MSSTVMPQTTSGRARWDWRIWFQWVLTNAIGEAIGLGGTAVVTVLLLLSTARTMSTISVAILIVVIATLIEGTVVGMAQWLVLRHPLQEIRWYIWVLATAIGAFVAWTLGMIPSTFLFTGPNTGAPNQMNEIVVYGLAAAMGFVLGPVLGIPQWLALRRHLSKAGWWVLANALAWMGGMVVIFVGTSFIPPEGFTLMVAFILFLFLVAAGALVGAIHGLVLIWLLQSRRLRD